ncbi:MAG: hypothetical protein ACREHD_07940, partial [Pirellulales bacterium]
EESMLAHRWLGQSLATLDQNIEAALRPSDALDAAHRGIAAAQRLSQRQGPAAAALPQPPL